MISHISIKNFAIIEDVSIDFHEGLNIITGETGAGKSIVIEAVSLALGARADTAFVRSGTDKAIVQLIAEDEDQEYIITREVTTAGKNLCKVNGEIVSLSQLNGLCKKIADIHGQYDHQSLLNPDNHIHLLDLYGSESISSVKELVSALFAEYKSTKNRLDQLLLNEKEDLRKRDFMAFELDEIEKAKLIPGEDDALDEEIYYLQSIERIYENLELAYQISSGEDGQATAGSSMDRILRSLHEVAHYSPELRDLSENFSDIYYKFEDIVSEIRRQKEKAVFSPEALDSAIQRQEFIDSLKRKYGTTIGEINEYARKLREKLLYIESSDEMRASLSHDLSLCQEKLKLASERLSSLRKDAALELEKKIFHQLSELNFNNSEISISFNSQPAPFSENGTDLVEFLISTNKGEPLKPLSKIASGGEMSRIMLAIKKIIADYDNIPTMIFDEIDSGISGIAASVVAKKLKEIADKHQIICITHLPQIAAAGKYNYCIVKESDEASTRTLILPLNTEEKVNEIARLLGGINITSTTLESARELIDASK